MEIVKKVVSDCERHFEIIKSALDVVVYQTLSDEAKKYLETVVPKIEEVNDMVKDMKASLSSLLDLKTLREAKDDVLKRNDSIKSQAIRDFDANVSDILNRKLPNNDNTEKFIHKFVDNPGDNHDFIDKVFSDVVDAFGYITKRAGEEPGIIARQEIGKKKLNADWQQ